MFGRMENEKLIYEVSKHVELFDTKHKCYFDSETRQKLWHEISKILEASPEHCKNRWRNLRTSFVNELRKTAKNSYNSSGKKYLYYQQMLFLLPYILHRKGNFEGNLRHELTELENNTTYDYEYNNSMNHSQISIECSQLEDKKEFIDLTSTDYKDYSIVDQQSPTHHHTDKQKQKRKRPSVTKCKREEKSDDDPLKQFFMTMYETVKKFPPHLQIAAKRAIFSEVTNFEEKTHERQYYTQKSNVNNCTN